MNKSSDDTYSMLKRYCRMQVIRVKYEDVENFLDGIIEAKEDFAEIIAMDLSLRLKPEYTEDLKTTSGTTDFTE